MPPVQKPGRSRQDYGTPDTLLVAVKHRLCIDAFTIDLAADAGNAVAGDYFDEKENALEQAWPFHGWNWLNPPFADISPWVKKAKEEAESGASTVVLVPASVGANWFATWVEPYAYQSYLNPRLTFKGETTPYPKDCMLLFYTPWGFTGHEIWHWKARIG